MCYGVNDTPKNADTAEPLRGIMAINYSTKLNEIRSRVNSHAEYARRRPTHERIVSNEPLRCDENRGQAVSSHARSLRTWPRLRHSIESHNRYANLLSTICHSHKNERSNRRTSSKTMRGIRKQYEVVYRSSRERALNAYKNFTQCYSVFDKKTKKKDIARTRAISTFQLITNILGGRGGEGDK